MNSIWASSKVGVSLPMAGAIAFAIVRSWNRRGNESRAIRVERREVTPHR